jgi:hypothetical protein
MKRFAAFEFETYYPGGGFNDFLDTFDTVEEATAAVDAKHKAADAFSPRGHIVDLTTGKIVKTLFSDGWAEPDA